MEVREAKAIYNLQFTVYGVRYFELNFGMTYLLKPFSSMRIFIVPIFLFVVVHFSACDFKKPTEPSPAISYNVNPDSSLIQERIKLKKYAFCKCMLNYYNKDSFLINDGSYQGYIETGSYGNIHMN